MNLMLIKLFFFLIQIFVAEHVQKVNSAELSYKRGLLTFSSCVNICGLNRDLLKHITRPSQFLSKYSRYILIVLYGCVPPRHERQTEEPSS